MEQVFAAAVKLVGRVRPPFGRRLARRGLYPKRAGLRWAIPSLGPTEAATTDVRL